MFMSTIGSFNGLWEAAARALPIVGKSQPAPNAESGIAQDEPASSPFSAHAPVPDASSTVPASAKQKLDFQQPPAPAKESSSTTFVSSATAWKTARNLVDGLKWTVGVAAVVGGITAGIAVGAAAGVLRNAAGAEVEKSLETFNECVKGGYYAGAAVFSGLGKLAELIDQYAPADQGAAPVVPEAANIGEYVMV